ncbi:MAG: hypothetical protein ACKVOE_06845 [Rickettsiales bacterium]
MRRVLLMLMPLLLMGCNALVDSSNTAADITHTAFNDTVSSWRDVFTYKPKAGPQSPQTRYCYKMQTDVVCYDSVQLDQTARLVGYQDGDQISWVQPGGGALGASGGVPNAARVSHDVQVSPTVASNTVGSSIIVSDAPTVTTLAPPNAPFAPASTAPIIKPAKPR